MLTWYAVSEEIELYLRAHRGEDLQEAASGGGGGCAWRGVMEWGTCAGCASSGDAGAGASPSLDPARAIFCTDCKGFRLACCCSTEKLLHVQATLHQLGSYGGGWISGSDIQALWRVRPCKHGSGSMRTP